jgi:glyoxylase-like metal-dependent hydrolase (beta-lactamase superfamily II)
MSAKRIGEGTTVAPTNWWKALPRKTFSELQRLQSSQPWFEVYKINPDVYVFYEPGQFEEVISYLVVGKERAVLIDTGLGMGNVKRLAEEFTSLSIMVVNTHSHYDHIAQNYLFDSVAIFDAPNARQAAKNGCSKAEMSRLLADGMLWKPLPEDFDPENYHVPPFTVTQWLKDGGVIDLGNRKLEVVYTPGHSPDSICLLDRNARLLWTGDTFYPAAIYIHLPGSDLDAFIKSYERMIALSSHYDRLLPSHNEPYVQKAALERVLQAAQDIKAGKGVYVEGVDGETRIRRYGYSGFAIIRKAY